MTSEAKFLLETFLSLFWGELLDFYCINVHGIRVFSCLRRGEGLESLGRPPALLGDLLHTVPLVLEMDCFGVPVVNLFWYSVERHDAFHERGRDSSGEETDQDIVVHDAGVGGVALEGGDVTFQQGGELPVLFGYSLGR